MYFYLNMKSTRIPLHCQTNPPILILANEESEFKFELLPTFFDVKILYRHFPPYPAFLNRACLMPPAVIPAIWSNPCSHRRIVNDPDLDREVSGSILTLLLLSKAKWKLMPDSEKGWPTRLFYAPVDKSKKPALQSRRSS